VGCGKDGCVELRLDKRRAIEVIDLQRKLSVVGAGDDLDLAAAHKKRKRGGAWKAIPCNFKSDYAYGRFVASIYLESPPAFLMYECAFSWQLPDY